MQDPASQPLGTAKTVLFVAMGAFTLFYVITLIGSPDGFLRYARHRVLRDDDFVLPVSPARA